MADKDTADWKKTACVLCGSNCGVLVQLGGQDGREIDRVRGDKEHPGTKGYTCNKALQLNYYQSAKSRLTSPLRRREDGSFDVGAVTGTASFRFSKWMKRWFEMSDCRVIIGKGGMSAEDYRDHFVPNGAVYLTTVGYGTGALLGRGIKRVQDVHWLEELGIAQAMWVLEVENFGPFLVESDLQGRSLFEEAGEKINERLDDLYAGLKKPALGRYGETTSRDDEVI